MTATVSEARIKRAFATFDYNNKGHVSHDELERILRALGFRGMSKQLVATFMRTTSTRKNPSEVTYGDCLRIIQSSGFDHIFEESFQVCQVLDKTESGRIVPEAMAKAAKLDGRFDAYIHPTTADGAAAPTLGFENLKNNLRRSSLLQTNAKLMGGSVTSNQQQPSHNGKASNADALEDDELTSGGDRRASEGAGGGNGATEASAQDASMRSLGIPPIDVNATITSSRKPLCPASAKRQRLFAQIHRFVNRADESSFATYTSAGLSSSPNSTLNTMSATAKLAQAAAAAEAERDTALTFDEWRQVQATAEKVNEADMRRRRRHCPQGSSLAATLRGANSSQISTPRGGSTTGVAHSMSGRW